MSVDPRSAREPGPPRDDAPFSLLLVGDFSGVGPGLERPVFVDRDEVDDAVGRLAPRLRIPLGPGGSALELDVGEMEDFHPDRLVRRVPLFRSILESNGSGTGTAAPHTPGTSSPAAPDTADLVGGDVLDGVLDATEGVESADDPLRRWFQELGEAHGVKESRPSADELEARELVDQGLRELLHHPRFRALEGVWRGVETLVRSVETGPRLRVWLLDLSRDAALEESEASPGEGLFHRILSDGDPRSGEPWSAVATAWRFAPRPDHLELLAWAGRTCMRYGCALLADANLPGLADPWPAPGTADPADDGAGSVVAGWTGKGWEMKRAAPWAARVALAAPRVLARLPYGEEGEPCWDREFEEIAGEPSTRDYLWAPAAFVAAGLLARAFTRAGWELHQALELEVGDRPLHTVRREGELRTRPCTEGALDRRDADRLLEAGISPVVWYRDTDRIRFVRLQSVARPPSRLQGPWGD